jgi:hypothetical protein
VSIGAIVSIAVEAVASSPTLAKLAKGTAYAVGAAALCGVIWYSGLKAGRQEAKVASLKAQIAKQARDLQIQSSVSAALKTQRDEAEKANNELQGKVNEYADELTKRPAVAACRLNSDDVKRLRAIR